MRKNIKPLTVAVVTALLAMSAHADIRDQAIKDSVIINENLQVGTEQAPVKDGIEVSFVKGSTQMVVDSGAGNDIKVYASSNALKFSFTKPTYIGTEQTGTVHLQADSTSGDAKAIDVDRSVNSGDVLTVLGKEIELVAGSSSNNAYGIHSHGSGSISIGSQTTEQITISSSSSSTSTSQYLKNSYGVSNTISTGHIDLAGWDILIESYSQFGSSMALNNLGTMTLSAAEDITIHSSTESGSSVGIQQIKNQSDASVANLTISGRNIEVKANAAFINQSKETGTAVAEIRAVNKLDFLSEVAGGRAIQNMAGSTLTLQGADINLKGGEYGLLNSASTFTAGSSQTQKLLISANQAQGIGFENNANSNAVLDGQVIEISGKSYGVNNLASNVTIGSEATQRITLKATQASDNDENDVAAVYSGVDSKGLGASSATFTAAQFDVDSAEVGIMSKGNGNDTLTVDAQNVFIQAQTLGILNNGSKMIIGADDAQAIVIGQVQRAGDAAGMPVEAIETNGGGTTSLKAQNINIQASEAGLVANEGSIEVEASHLVVAAAGENSQALVAQANVEGNVAAIKIAADSTMISATSGAGITATSYGKVDISGDLTVDAEDVISARGNSTVNINQNGSAKVVLNGNVAFSTPGSEGDAGEDVNANVNIRLTGAGSQWTGNAYASAPEGVTTTNVKGMNVALINGAQWNPTLVEGLDPHGNPASVQSINILEFSDGVINLSETGAQTVAVEKTTGTGGAVKLHTKVAKDGSMRSGSVDFGTVAEDMQFDVEYTGITADDVNGASLSDIEGGVTAQGGKSVAQTKMVRQGAVLGTLIETYDENGNMTSRTQADNTRLTAYGSVAALGITQWRHDMNDLTKRMGELRTSPEGVGAWARLYGSEQEYGSQSVTAKNTSIQIGADFDVGAGWKVGAAFTYTDGSATYDLGDADNKAYGFALYGSWFAENGQFVDLIAKYSRLDTDFALEGMDGSYDNNAYSISAEYGWHFKLGDLAFIEPQVELTYGQISGDDFDTGNGVKVEQDDFDSFIGRVGFRTGFLFPENKGTIYARASVLHDFQGEFDSTASLVSDRSVSDRVSEDLGGTWYEYGVGANFNWTDSTYTYVDLERNSGGEVKENWRWNVGLRHVF